MYKKKTSLPLRPEPPTIEKIIEDVEGCHEDDVVFASMLNDGKRDDIPDPMTESFASMDEVSLPSSATSLTDQNDAQSIYKKTLTYVKLIDTLKDAPDELQRQSDNMEELRSELQQSIDDLKEKSQTALDKSVNSR